MIVEIINITNDDNDELFFSSDSLLCNEVQLDQIAFVLRSPDVTGTKLDCCWCFCSQLEFPANFCASKGVLIEK